MQTDFITQRIESHLAESLVYVNGDGTHFVALVVSSAFEGKSRVARQQLVYDSVRAELLDGSLHALSVKAYTPTEWSTLHPEEGHA